MIATLATSGRCSYLDLRDRLSLEEAYMIAEADYVDRHNRNLAEKLAYERAERKV